MNPESEHIEELIGKFLVGEVSEAEAKELREWCAISPENQKYLDDARWIYEKAQLPGHPEFDSEKAWSKVNSRINPDKGKFSIFLPFWKIAAGLVLLLGLTYLFFLLQTPAQEFLLVSENNTLIQLMPDQTEITLNRNSEIQVTYHERKSTGTIYLTGEALISIPENKKVNWRVKTGDLVVEDIGTVFHVKALPDSPLVEVSVQEGMVRFYSTNQDGITLNSGEKGIYDKSTDTFSKTTVDPNVASFKTLSLNFQEETLGNVVSKLEEVYGKNFQLEGEIASCRISVFFENEELDTILSIISETLGLEVIEDGNLIRLIGDTCY